MTTITDPKVETNITYRTVLLQAVEETHERGHCANEGECPDGEHCVMALLSDAMVALGVWNNHRLYVEAMNAVQRAIGGECPVDWNCRQNAASVIAMFERAALAKGKS